MQKLYFLFYRQKKIGEDSHEILIGAFGGCAGHNINSAPLRKKKVTLISEFNNEFCNSIQ